MVTCSSPGRLLFSMRSLAEGREETCDVTPRRALIRTAQGRATQQSHNNMFFFFVKCSNDHLLHAVLDSFQSFYLIIPDALAHLQFSEPK